MTRGDRTSCDQSDKDSLRSTRMKIAFAGFRHGHIMSLYSAAQSDARVQIVAACEEDAAVAASLREARQVLLTQESFDDVLATVDCDVIAVGDYFARRGALIIAALRAGKHVISDKPICASIGELDQIEALARKNGRAVSALLDLRDRGPYRTMRKLIRDGAIGETHTIAFSAQHPLLLGKRPAWYFEPGKHGGTINDIAVHATDLIPWLCGKHIARVVASRAWNARLPQHPQFQDAAHLMFELDNGGGVLGDVSYLSPDGLGYTSPTYWRVTCHGSDGFVEADYNGRQVMIATSEDKSVRAIAADSNVPGGRIDDLLSEIRGESRDVALTSVDVFRASRWALLAQKAAMSAT